MGKDRPMSTNENKNNPEYIKFLDSMFSGLGSSEGLSLDEVMEEIKEDGIDFGPILKRLKNQVEHYSKSAKLQRLDIARENRLKTTSEVHSIARNISTWTRERITQEIERISLQLGSGLSISHRDLSKKTTEDLKSLLLDLEALSNKSQDEE
jgi:hypothetical protein